MDMLLSLCVVVAGAIIAVLPVLAWFKNPTGEFDTFLFIAGIIIVLLGALGLISGDK